MTCPLGQWMSPERYRLAIRDLGLTQFQAARFFGQGTRAGARWAKQGPPQMVAMFIYLIESQKMDVKEATAILRMAKNENHLMVDEPP